MHHSMHKTRLYYALDLKKDIRLSKTAGKNPTPACIGPATLEEWNDDRERRTARKRLGGADRDRTDDLRLAKPALSQLSYSP